MNDQRALDTKCGSIATIDPLHLPVDESIGHIGNPRQAVLGQSAAQEAKLAHLAQDLTVVEGVPGGREDAGHQLGLGVGTGLVHYH